MPAMPGSQTSELTIRFLGPKGDGTHLGPRGKVYVERALPGEKLRARIHKDEKGIYRGEILQLLLKSPQRQMPPCPHYDSCGNCTLQHLAPTYYRQWKENVVKDALRKVGLVPRRWLPSTFLGFENRRRVNFTAVSVKGKITLGYYKRRSREISEIESCLIADPKLLEVKKAIKPHLKGILSEREPLDIFLQLVGNSVDVVLAGPVGRTGRPDQAVRQAMQALIDSTPLTRLSWTDEAREKFEPVFQKGRVLAQFGSLTVALPPAAFLQASGSGEQALVKAVLSALPPKGRFADLFSGCGTFSGPMLERGSVDAFESLPRAASALAKSAGDRPLQVFRRDLFRRPLGWQELKRYTAVVFDPPRGGCYEQAGRFSESRVPLLVGVSCNPATFARDAAILCDGGYRLESVQIIDQFAYSHHVEMVGVFRRG